VQGCGRSQNCGAEVDATIVLSSAVASLQLLGLLQGMTDTKLQISNRIPVKVF